MNTTGKAIIVALAAVLAIGLTAGTALALTGPTAVPGQQGGGMMSGVSSHGGTGMMGGYLSGMANWCREMFGWHSNGTTGGSGGMMGR